ncbi:MAG: hypothetical protein JXQ71_02020, partial [Verrucomicrobia bacterium]|nr:hypothetical protein [Verrucomicrobiota bacterium]
MKTLQHSFWKSVLTLALLVNAPAAFADPVTVAADIASNTTWHATNEYYLDGYVYVLGGATLTIEAGTVIKGLESPTT